MSDFNATFSLIFVVYEQVCCSARTVSEIVTKLNLTRLSKQALGATADVFIDERRGAVMKVLTGYGEYGPHVREACVLRLLSRFEWAPKLLCARGNVIMSTYVGRPLCERELRENDSFRAQLRNIFADLRSVGVKQNDLAKHYVKELLVLNNRVSLVDYGWATVDGRLDVKCSLHGEEVGAPDARPRNNDLDAGFRFDENSVDFVARHLRNCERGASTRAAFGKYMNENRNSVGSQSETPTIFVDEAGNYQVGGYHSFSISPSGKIWISRKKEKYAVVLALLRDLYADGSRSFIDVGSNTGIVSFLARGVGYAPILALDHDAEAVEVVKEISLASVDNASAVTARLFSFGDEIPNKADVLYMGSLIHWVWCLTADFGGDFTRIIRYGARFATKVLVVEFVGPEDAAVKQFGHTSRCRGVEPERTYTAENFEKAIRETGGKVVRVKQTEPHRTLYAINIAAIV